MFMLFAFFKLKNAGTQPKIPAHKKYTCDPLSPYVGIIQIRFWVKASAYSQPACASTPFSRYHPAGCLNPYSRMIYLFQLSTSPAWWLIVFNNNFIIHVHNRNASAILFIRQIHISSTHLNETEVLHPPSHLRHCLTILLPSFCPHKLRILLTLYLTVSFWFCPRLSHNTLMRHGT